MRPSSTLLTGLLLASMIMLSACPRPQAQTPSGDGCMIGGCSGQLCVEAAQGAVSSTCEFRPAYACYGRHSQCKRQPDGRCGWTPTAELNACLKAAK
jgi:hypothetical protein